MFTRAFFGADEDATLLLSCSREAPGIAVFLRSPVDFKRVRTIH